MNDSLALVVVFVWLLRKQNREASIARMATTVQPDSKTSVGRGPGVDVDYIRQSRSS